jgi:hypothetical protein
MTGTVRPAVEAIWQVLGVGVPPEAIGSRHSFVVDDIEMELRLARDGRGIELTGRLGRLGAHPQQAADQQRRLLRLGLGLAMVNRAAPVMPAGAERPALEAMARGDLDQAGPPDICAVTALDQDLRRDAPRALQDLAQWRHFARPILGETIPPDAGDDDLPSRPRRSASSDAERGYFIFQP